MITARNLAVAKAEKEDLKIQREIHDVYDVYTHVFMQLQIASNPCFDVCKGLAVV